ncbi:hypothetical protein FRACA_2980006 [Frankia canadensis]|uniref:ChrR-like cupin domain-containing protein n=1 Tax=Frankia canadensis TaxID=1836972 RepID=A0A2I2KTK7_9ACTN|nr:hypothetical protein [Frankia canadensis]SNQ48992.1 hypothetical protein FRACA_2980006 [Frankia canadensis]SOU56282.1 hypothetical protein FRACA_2980006 [Frankia canadensis]
MERTARGRYETNLDDPEFTTMEDGTRFAAFFLGAGPSDPAVFPMEVTANYKFPVHYHKTHYMSVILRGSLRVGKKWYGPGDIRLQEKGSVYGPEEAGPDGCFMLNIFADRRGYVPSILGEPAPEEVDVPPHVLLSKVWNALAETESAEGESAETGSAEGERVPAASASGSPTVV